MHARYSGRSIVCACVIQFVIERLIAAPPLTNTIGRGGMSTSLAYCVCLNCFREDPTDYGRLSAELECRRHPNAKRVEVYWDYEHSRFNLYKIRPLPNKEISGRFIICRFDRNCKGERCTYAHSRAEQEEWNRLKSAGECTEPAHCLLRHWVFQ